VDWVKLPNQAGTEKKKEKMGCVQSIMVRIILLLAVVGKNLFTDILMKQDFMEDMFTCCCTYMFVLCCIIGVMGARPKECIIQLASEHHTTSKLEPFFEWTACRNYSVSTNDTLSSSSSIGQVLSTVGFIDADVYDTSNCIYHATVPGTILTSLIRNGTFGYVLFLPPPFLILRHTYISLLYVLN
jgi:hypothetical protein